MLWDLCHSAGAVPVDLLLRMPISQWAAATNFSMAGRGHRLSAMSHRAHLNGLRQPLQGWMGHAAPFEFAADYRPAPASMRYGRERRVCSR